MGISAKIIQSSISPSGKRIDTLEIELPRIVLAELNTHRAISKNAESGRAIPFTALEEKVKGDMFIPKFTPKQRVCRVMGSMMLPWKLTEISGDIPLRNTGGRQV